MKDLLVGGKAKNLFMQITNNLKLKYLFGFYVLLRCVFTTNQLLSIVRSKVELCLWFTVKWWRTFYTVSLML